MTTQANTCPVCKRPFWTEQCGDTLLSGCSEFCAQTSDKEKVALATLKPGDWGVWPCSECGCPIEDEYNPAGHCSACVPTMRSRALESVLREVAADYRNRVTVAQLSGRSGAGFERMLRKIEAAIESAGR